MDAEDILQFHQRMSELKEIVNHAVKEITSRGVENFPVFIPYVSGALQNVNNGVMKLIDTRNAERERQEETGVIESSPRPLVNKGDAQQRAWWKMQRQEGNAQMEFGVLTFLSYLKTEPDNPYPFLQRKELAEKLYNVAEAINDLGIKLPKDCFRNIRKAMQNVGGRGIE